MDRLFRGIPPRGADRGSVNCPNPFRTLSVKKGQMVEKAAAWCGRIRPPPSRQPPTSSVDPTIVLFGFGVGFLVGLTGMGGGSLMTPLLILVFGVKPVTAIGTDIFYAAVTKTAGRLAPPEAEDGEHAADLVAGGGQRALGDRRRLGAGHPQGHARRRAGRNRVRDPRLVPAGGGRDHAAAQPLPRGQARRARRLRDPHAPQDRRGRDRRHHRLRHRALLGGQRHRDRDHADRRLPPHPEAGSRHRRLPRRDPALGGGDRTRLQRQRRLRLGREHPAGLGPRA